MALTEDRNTALKDGILVAVPVAASTKIYQGAGVVLDGGYAKPASSTLDSAITAGVADETVDNSEGNDGDLTIKVRRLKAFLFDNSAQNPVTQSHVGGLCYWEDDHTVCSDSEGPAAGVVLQVTDSGVWVFVYGGIEAALKEAMDEARIEIVSVPLKDCVANTTTRTSILAVGPDGAGAMVVGATVMFYTKPSSDAGTVEGILKRWDAASDQEVTLMDNAIDLESLTDKESADLTLTATASKLVLGAGDSVYFEVTSNNSDMTGGTDGVLTLVIMKA